MIRLVRHMCKGLRKDVRTWSKELWLGLVGARTCLLQASLQSSEHVCSHSVLAEGDPGRLQVAATSSCADLFANRAPSSCRFTYCPGKADEITHHQVGPLLAGVVIAGPLCLVGERKNTSPRQSAVS